MKKNYLHDLRIDLEHWFCSTGYKKEMVHSEIQKVHSMNRENLLKKREKQDDNDSLTLVLTYHPALNKVHEILKKTHRHTIGSPRLSAISPSTTSSCISQSKNNKRSFSKIKTKDT